MVEIHHAEKPAEFDNCLRLGKVSDGRQLFWSWETTFVIKFVT